MIVEKFKKRDPADDEEVVAEYLSMVPSNKALDVDFMTKEFKPQSAWAEQWEAFIKAGWDHKLKILKKVVPEENVKLNGLPIVPLKKLFREHLKQAIELEECQVVSISEVKPYDEQIRFMCQHCGATGNPESKKDWFFPKDEPFVKPGKHGCDFPQIVEVTDPAIDSIDSQWIKIQELYTESSDVPQFLDCLLKGRDMMWTISFHERVSLIGLLRFTRVKERDGSSTYRKWFEVFGVKKVDPDAAIQLTEQDIAYIQAEQKKPGYLDKLVASFAPHIRGMETFKEAILLTLASMKLPRPGRLLMVTDPSMGKSELLLYTVSLVPTAQHTQMGRSTNAGLTLSSEKDEQTGRRFVTRGAAVAAHNSLLCIDELQIGREEHFKNLNDLLESGKVRYAMAGGFRGQMDANCALIMSCNPHKGRFIGEDERLEEVLEFMGNDLPQFISRINIILMRRDHSTPEEEKEIVSHMARQNPNDSEYLAAYRENWYDVHHPIEEAIQTPLKGFTIITKYYPERFGTKWIKKIINYVTNYVQPTAISEAHQKALVEYYMRNRLDVETHLNKLVTKRFIRHIITVSQYMARLQGKSTPSDADIQRTISLLEKTMSVAAWDGKNKRLDTNNFDGNYSEEKLEIEEKANKTKQFREAMKLAMRDEQGRDKNFFTMQDIKFRCQMLQNSKWTDEYKVEQEVQKLHNDGKLMNLYGQGKYTPVG